MPLYPHFGQAPSYSGKLLFLSTNAVSGEAVRFLTWQSARGRGRHCIQSHAVPVCTAWCVPRWFGTCPTSKRSNSLTQTFSELGLPATIVAALDSAGFNVPTPIQAKAIPHQLAGKDILGIAQTGSGKTAAFGLPIIAGIAELKGRASPMTTRALILAPTRELAVQIDEVLQKLSAGLRLSTVLVLGGACRVTARSRRSPRASTW